MGFWGSHDVDTFWDRSNGKCTYTDMDTLWSSVPHTVHAVITDPRLMAPKRASVGQIVVDYTFDPPLPIALPDGSLV